MLATLEGARSDNIAVEFYFQVTME